MLHHTPSERTPLPSTSALPPPDPRDRCETAARAIMRAMAKNPQERYPTAGEFVADLTPIQ